MFLGRDAWGPNREKRYGIGVRRADEGRHAAALAHSRYVGDGVGGSGRTGGTGNRPFFLYPSKAYMRWRMETVYGEGSTVVPSRDLERYLRWGSDMRRRMKGSEKW